MTENWYTSEYSSLKTSDNTETDGITNFDQGIFLKEVDIIFKKYIPEEFDVELYAKESRSTREWLNTVLYKGTSHDRIAALTYLTAIHPLNTLSFLDTLIGFVAHNKQRSTIKAIETINGLFISSLLPDRELLSLSDRSSDMIKELPKYTKAVQTKSGLLPEKKTYEYVIILWKYEHELKIRYNRYLKAVENVILADTVDAVKRCALNNLVSLWVKKPEQSHFIVSVIVNKLGDRNPSFVSGVLYKLRLSTIHFPRLLEPMLDELQRFLYRPNLLERSRYYGINLLSTLPLPKKKIKNGMNIAEFAIRLIKIYSGFFNVAVKEKQLSENLITSLLLGMKRCVPHVREEHLDSIRENLNDVFRLVHTSNSFSISLQALSLLFLLAKPLKDIKDRYYRALYKKMMDPDIRLSSKKTAFMHLLYQSMLADDNVARICSFVQRLLQLTVNTSDPCYIIASLITISKILHIPCLKTTDLLGHGNISKLTNGSQRKLLPFANSSMEKMKQFADDEEEHFSDAVTSDEEEEVKPATAAGGSGESQASSWYPWMLM